MREMNIAVIGATGLVGQTFMRLLESRNFPVKNFYPFASEKSAGKKLEFNNEEYTVLCEKNIEEQEYDIAFFSAGGQIAKDLAERFVNQGAIVIDNSSAFRMDENVPLVIPEINEMRIDEHNGIIANPNCSTIQMLMVLAPLRLLSPIKRVVVSTYQSVSGSGLKAMEELKSQMREFVDGEKVSDPVVYPYHILNNSLPHIDRFLENGYTFEEMKMIQETYKIMEEDIPLTVTCVRVPVLCCHSEAINVEFENEVSLEEIRTAFKEFPGVELMDNPENLIYPLQGDLEGTDQVHVGRIRMDYSADNAVNLWCSTDNIQKGAALNGIQIAEYILNN